MSNPQLPDSGEPSELLSGTIAQQFSRRPPALELPPFVGEISRVRISDVVFEHLKEAIRSLELLPGTAISEAGITGSLGVGRSPVREALARLVDLGLVSVTPQVGGRIAPISIRQVEEAVFMRSSLEIGAFKRAIAGDAPDTGEMHRLVDKNTKAGAEGNMELFFETDEQLHQKVFELAGMARIWEVVRGTKVQLDRLRQLNLPLSIRNLELVDEHQAIVDALSSQDIELGVTTIHRHSTRIFETVEELRSANPSYFAP